MGMSPESENALNAMLLVDLVSVRHCFESDQEAPGGGGCAGVVPGMTNPGGNWKPFGMPGNWKPKPGTAGATPMVLLSRLSVRSGWR